MLSRLENQMAARQGRRILPLNATGGLGDIFVRILWESGAGCAPFPKSVRYHRRGSVMSQYLMRFAKSYLGDKNDAYIALLWSLYKANEQKGRYSDQIKQYLSSNADRVPRINFQKMARRALRVLNAKPELEWLAPEGLTRLRELRASNFRGFGQLGPDDRGTHLTFSRNKNIFYAPNGGGKTSLCEAIEYGTTGHIKEADRRRTKLRQYISRGSAKPALALHDINGKEVVRSISWSGCFIDRNRLQEFSLLGSKDTGILERDVVATLFGLGDLQEVINKFVRPESFSLKSLVLPTGTEQAQLIDSDVASIKTSSSKLRDEIDGYDIEVCTALNLKPHEKASIRLAFGRLTKLAELKAIKAERLRLLGKPESISSSQLARIATLSDRLLKRHLLLSTRLSSQSSNLKFQAIYEAVNALGEDQSDGTCPACSTPIQLASENPFGRAKAQLNALRDLSDLQRSKARIESRMVVLASTICGGLRAFDHNSTLGLTCNLELESLRVHVSEFENSSARIEAAHQMLAAVLHIKDAGLPIAFDYAEQCRLRIDTHSNAANLSARLELQAQALRSKVDLLRGIFTKKSGALRELRTSGPKLADLYGRQHGLRSLAGQNEAHNLLMKKVEGEYENLYHDLLNFKLQLESERLSGIEDGATQYYQAINRHDSDHEQISSLKFEKDSDAYRIKIVDLHGRALDAFSVLSEGHLRVLGLSILLAMAEKNALPLIVFDDVVNAIDSDHRSNILDLLFSDRYLSKTQIIITTHDRLFWERFSTKSEKHPQADQHSGSVLSYTNKGIVVIDYSAGFRSRIRRALDVYDIRQALIYCRIWFETMVVDFCVAKELAITATFSKRSPRINNYLQVSLERTYSLVEGHISFDATHFSHVKSDLVNWSGQNQEHHAFDEGGLNFVHSKTSTEVVGIYNALRFLECQLFSVDKQKSCTTAIQDLTENIARQKQKIANLGKAPLHVQEASEARVSELEAEKAALEEELAYINHCVTMTGA